MALLPLENLTNHCIGNCDLVFFSLNSLIIMKSIKSPLKAILLIASIQAMMIIIVDISHVGSSMESQVKINGYYNSWVCEGAGFVLESDLEF